MKNPGSLEVITGCVRSGKTDKLILWLRRVGYAKRNLQVFRVAVIETDDDLRICSGAGTEFPAAVVRESGEILRLVEPSTQVLAIDNAHFFDDGIISVVERLVNRGIRVIMAGLDLDFRTEPFGPIPVLMAKADKVDKLSAICTICGEPAYCSQRLIDGKPASFDAPFMVVGLSDVYEPRCRLHYKMAK